MISKSCFAKNGKISAELRVKLALVGLYVLLYSELRIGMDASDLRLIGIG